MLKLNPKAADLVVVKANHLPTCIVFLLFVLYLNFTSNVIIKELNSIFPFLTNLWLFEQIFCAQLARNAIMDRTYIYQQCKYILTILSHQKYIYISFYYKKKNKVNAKNSWHTKQEIIYSPSLGVKNKCFYFLIIDPNFRSIFINV